MLKEHLRFPQEVVNAVRTCGSSVTTKLETRCEALLKEKEHLLQSGTDGKVMRSTELSACPLLVGRMGYILGPQSCISVSTTMQRNRREKYI